MGKGPLQRQAPWLDLDKAHGQLTTRHTKQLGDPTHKIQIHY